MAVKVQFFLKTELEISQMSSSIDGAIYFTTDGLNIYRGDGIDVPKKYTDVFIFNNKPSNPINEKLYIIGGAGNYAMYTYLNGEWINLSENVYIEDVWNSVVDFQEDNTLDPSLKIGSRYIILDSSNLHANFGTIEGVEDNDVVVYNGSEFAVDFDASESNMSIEVLVTSDNQNWYYSVLDSSWLNRNKTTSSFKPILFWDFNSDNISDWTQTASVLSVPNNSITRYTATDNNPRIYRNCNINGGQNSLIKIRYKVIAGTQLNGSIFYATSGHGIDGNYRKFINLLDNSEWNITELDMSDLDFGGSDWIDNDIIQIRFDLGESNDVIVDIDWIGIGKIGWGTNYIEETLIVDGIVGIGTFSPVSKLHVNANSDNTSILALEAGNNGRKTVISHQSDGIYDNAITLINKESTVGEYKFTNLNGTLFHVLEDAKFGIGLSPNSNAYLHVKSNTSSWGLMTESNGANYSGIYFTDSNESHIVGRNTVGTIVNMLNSNGDSYIKGGNLGIGTSDIEAWNSNYGAIEFYDSAIMHGKTSQYIANVSNAYYDSGGWKYKGNSTASMYEQYSGMHYWSIAPSGTMNTSISWTTAMHINSNGNVGLSTTDIEFWSSLHGAIEFPLSSIMYSKSTTDIYYNSNAYYDGAWRYKISGQYSAQYSQSNGIHVWYSTTSTGIENNSISWKESMRINTSGQVLIGKTTAEYSNSALEVKGGGIYITNASGSAISILNYQANGNSYITGDTTSGTGDGEVHLRIYNGTVYTSHAVLKSNGTFGIGQTSPSSKLHVLDTVDIDNDVTIAKFHSTQSTNPHWNYLEIGAAGGYGLGRIGVYGYDMTSASTISIQTNSLGTWYTPITMYGLQVGIGGGRDTSSPFAVARINGTIKIDGDGTRDIMIGGIQYKWPSGTPTPGNYLQVGSPTSSVYPLSWGTGASGGTGGGLNSINGYTESAVSISGSGSISVSSSGDGSANQSHVISISQSSASSNGYLSSTDWSTFNQKQAALSGTGIVKSTAGTISYITDNSTNWNTAYTSRIASLTTTGSSGAATLISNVLNIPNYTLSGLGGVSTSRTITINGTAYDLSANRSWTVGDITSVIAGTALTGGGASGDVTLNVNLGTGSTQAAYGNHTHSGVYDNYQYWTLAIDGANAHNLTTLDVLNIQGGNGINITSPADDAILISVDTNDLSPNNIIDEFGSLTASGGVFTWSHTNENVNITTNATNKTINITGAVNGESGMGVITVSVGSTIVIQLNGSTTNVRIDSGADLALTTSSIYMVTWTYNGAYLFCNLAEYVTQ